MGAVLGLLALLGAVGGCQGPRPDGGLRDPLEPVNRATFKFNLAAHDLVIGPVAGAYQEVTPDPVERAVSRFFENLTFPHVLVNDLLQLEFKQALQSTGRFTVNTTVGMGGFFDPATELGLPPRQQSFGITAARWGLEPGPYLVLPLIGPQTARNLPDIPLRILTNPVFYLDGGILQIALSGSGAMDRAAAHRDGIRRVKEAASPYVFLRESYWQRQQALIRDTEDETFEVFDALPADLDEAADPEEAVRPHSQDPEDSG